MREQGFNEAVVCSQYIQRLIPEIDRAWFRRLLRDAQFMRGPGKLLFRVGHLSCPKGGMGRTWEDHLVVASDDPGERGL